MRPLDIKSLFMTDSNIKKAWSTEYKRKGIPSSYRLDPSETVVKFLSWYKEREQKPGGIAADIGCGQGRNSYYLASQGFRVFGIELLEENALLINTYADSQKLPIEVFAQSAADTWPIASNCLDIAIDIFCYKHIAHKKAQEKYRHELCKALRFEGFYFISLASIEDGFYGPLLQHSLDPQNKLIVDPYSTIPSFLYSVDSLIQEFSDHFEIVDVEQRLSVSPMYGKHYQRKVLNCVFRKRNK